VAEPRFKVSPQPCKDSDCSYHTRNSFYFLSSTVVWQQIPGQPNVVQEATSVSLFTVLPLCGNLQTTLYQQRSYQVIIQLLTLVSTAILTDWNIQHWTSWCCATSKIPSAVQLTEQESYIVIHEIPRNSIIMLLCAAKEAYEQTA